MPAHPCFRGQLSRSVASKRLPSGVAEQWTVINRVDLRRDVARLFGHANMRLVMSLSFRLPRALGPRDVPGRWALPPTPGGGACRRRVDRKSTRLNSSHYCAAPLTALD